MGLLRRVQLCKRLQFNFSFWWFCVWIPYINKWLSCHPLNHRKFKVLVKIYILVVLRPLRNSFFFINITGWTKILVFSMSTYFRLELIELINMLARSNNRSVLRMIGAVQFVHLTLCFFQRFYNIPDSVLPLFSLGVSQCVYTHQAGRTPALQRNAQS